jgi:DNA-binding CsgD family transcriptional regulator
MSAKYNHVNTNHHPFNKAIEASLPFRGFRIIFDHLESINQYQIFVSDEYPQGIKQGLINSIESDKYFFTSQLERAFISRSGINQTWIYRDKVAGNNYPFVCYQDFKPGSALKILNALEVPEDLSNKNSGPKYSIHPALTRREKEVLACLLAGMTNREIGQQLYISRHTVNIHRNNIYKKTGVNSIKELIRNFQTKTYQLL